MNQNELYHHGILGMKWGVRRSPAQLGRSSKKKHTPSEDYSMAKEIKRKKVSEMSNAELKKVNERQQLERTYSQFNKGTVAKGLAFVTAAATATTAVINLYNNSDKLIGIGKKLVESSNNLPVKIGS